MPARSGKITSTQLFAMGDIGPCELVDGEIVPMSPTGGLHGWLESALGASLHAFVEKRDLGWVLVGEVGVQTRRDPDRVRGADVVFISRNRLPDGLPVGFLEAPPELVVEVMSPSDQWRDVRQKLAEYFSLGVERVWVVEPKRRVVRVYSEPGAHRALVVPDVLEGEGLLDGFALPLARLFSTR